MLKIDAKIFFLIFLQKHFDNSKNIINFASVFFIVLN